MECIPLGGVGRGPGATSQGVKAEREFKIKGPRQMRYLLLGREREMQRDGQREMGRCVKQRERNAEREKCSKKRNAATYLLHFLLRQAAAGGGDALFKKELVEKRDSVVGVRHLGFHCGKGARRVQGGQNRDVAAAHKMSAAHFRNVLDGVVTTEADDKHARWVAAFSSTRLRSFASAARTSSGGEICAKGLAVLSFFLDAKISTVHDAKCSVGVMLGDDSLGCIHHGDERSFIA
jgi:hypothetical protein